MASSEQSTSLIPSLPVYILYLTAGPGPAGMTFPPHTYGRAPTLLAQLRARRGGGPR